jgi:hypothetical protein
MAIKSMAHTVKNTFPIIGQIIYEKLESRFRYFYYRKKWHWRIPLIGNLGYSFLLRKHTLLKF